MVVRRSLKLLLLSSLIAGTILPAVTFGNRSSAIKIASGASLNIQNRMTVDGTIKKGRFAQELAMLIDKDFEVPEYIQEAICFILKLKGIAFPC